MCVLVIIKDLGVFQDKKNKLNGAKHRQDPRGKPNTGDEFTFQQDNNTIYIGVAYQEDCECP
jgi:hypothetical protein